MTECPKPRFKGIENFLRRLAFNLGNSPSQTDVKIISCIPIDVADLQQKIFDLERLVARFQKPPPAAPAIVNTALCNSGTKGNLSLNISSSIPIIDNNTSSYDNNQMLDRIVEPNERHNTKPSPGSSVNSMTSKDNNKQIKKIFSKKPRKKSTNKSRNQFVYYAQADSSPFKTRSFVDKKSTITNNETKDRNTFLADIIRKQYQPLMYNFSGESDFSSPVCRDIECSHLTTNVSEICSCCHLDFLNIDKNNAIQDYDFTPTFREQIRSQHAYYDSSLYDLVPVKETPIKVKKNFEISKKYYRNAFNFANYVNNKDMPYAHPMQFNHNKPRVAQCISRRTPARKTCMRKPPPRRMKVYNTAEENVNEDTANSCRIECGSVYKKAITNPKPLNIRKVKKPIITYNNAETETLNNTECQTVNETHNVETESIISDDKTEQTLNQIKSILESVLTEVKTNRNPVSDDKRKKDAVVQKGTSLGNMPGSSRLLNSFSYNTGPYGAACSHPINPGQYWSGVPYSGKCMHNFPVFIQTPGRLPCTSYLRNSTHMPKQSPQPATRKAANTSTSTEVHNHETEKLIKEIYKSIALNIDVQKKDTSASNCSSAWKHSSRTSTKSGYRTDKSINARQDFMNSMAQEGYRSNANRPLSPFASNIYNNKITSNTVSVQSHRISSTDTDRRLRDNHRFRQYMDNKVRSVGLTPTDTERRLRNNKVRYYLDAKQEMQFHGTTGTSSTDTEVRLANAIGQYLDAPQEMPSEESTETTVTQVGRTPVSMQAQTSSEESEEEEEQNTYQPTEVQSEKKERKSLFSKMIKSVKLFKNRKRKSLKSSLKRESDEEEESDSDDYQTVYSQQAEQLPQQARRPMPIQIHVPPRRVPHSKVSYSRQMRGRNQEKNRRSLLEQEYRRQWAEQLAFKEQQQRQRFEPSDRAYTSSQRSRRRCAAKPAMVEQSIPIQSTMFKDVLSVIPQQRVAQRNQKAENVRTTAAGAGPPKGLSWFKRRMYCGQHIVKSLIENN